MKPEEFLTKYLPFALENEKQSGVPHLVTLAQAALESGWGKHLPGNNFFGIKAGKSWKGKAQSLTTTEFDKGKEVKVVQTFRAYDSPKDCFADHAELLKKRFPKAFKHNDPFLFITSIQNEHEYKYATDPDYVHKISNIIYMLMDEKKGSTYE